MFRGFLKNPMIMRFYKFEHNKSLLKLGLVLHLGTLAGLPGTIYVIFFAVSEVEDE